MLQHRRFTYLVLLVLAVVAPLILRNDYLRDVLVLTLIFAILALSLDLIMGHMGQFSFGHQAFFGLGAYTSALLSLKLGISPWLGFLAATAFSGAVGFLVGFASLRAMRGMYLAITTLGFGMILLLIVPTLPFAGGPMGLVGIPSPVIALPLLPEIVVRSPFSYYYLMLALLVFTIYLISRFLRSRFGRGLTALRENESLASSIGIKPFRHYLLTFTLACALAGLAGAGYVHYMRFLSPGLLGLDYMFVMLIMVIVGGSGTLGGPVLGAIIFVWVSEFLRELGAFRFLVFGVILLVVIIFMRRGIYPRLTSLWDRFIVQRVWPKRKPG